MRNCTIKSTLIALLCGVSCTLFSQNVAINKSGNSPYASAILDLSNHNTVGTFGFLPPYVTLTAIGTFGLSGSPAQSNGIIVYNTGGTVPAGLYYWNNTLSTWEALNSGGSSLTGTGTVNYIARWTSASVLGIGVAQDNGTGVGISASVITPKSLLDVNGNVSIGTYAGNNAAPSNGMIVSGQVGVGNNSPASSAIVDLTNTHASGGTGAPLVWPTNPNPSTNITIPYLGEEIFNTTTGCFDFYNGTVWMVAGCPCSVAPPTPTISATGSCPLAFGGSSVTYKSSITTGATFFWAATATTGNPTLSANGLDSITVTWPSGGAGTGTVTVTLGNTCGSTTATQTVTIDGISGPTPIGLSSVGNIYTCSPSGATSYLWSSNNTNEGLIVGSNTGQSISVDAGSTSGTFTLTCIVTIGSCVYTATYPVVVMPCSHGTTTYTWNGDSNVVWDGSTTTAFQNGTFQRWVIPSCINTITITATGGAGGPWDNGNGGLGAVITSNSITVTPGDVLDIIVGGRGTAISVAYGGGGGGGSFVWDSNTATLLVVAGGGGGGGYDQDGDGANAQITNTSALALETATNNIYNLNGAGGTGGGASSGGAEGVPISYSGQGCGGAGWGENGAIVPAGNTWPYNGNGYYPFDPTYPAYGGIPWTDNAGTSGGFGGYGGGAGGGWNGGGGGGGYNGGGGGSDDFDNDFSYGGGGGGSYCNGTVAASTAYGSLNTNGSVSITY